MTSVMAATPSLAFSRDSGDEASRNEPPARAIPARAIYVDCGSGEEVNQGGTGAAEDPIRDLATLNKQSFGPGTRIRFKRGSVCLGMFHPREGQSGRSGSPIIVDAYGPVDRDRPLIAAGCFRHGARTKPPAPHHLPPTQVGGAAVGSSPLGDYPTLCDGSPAALAPAAIYLRNVEFWEVRELEVTNDGVTPGLRQGILVELEEFGDGRHYRIDDVFVHHVRGILTNAGEGSDFVPAKQSGGIQFRVVRPQASNGGIKTRFVGVEVTNSTIWAVDLIGLSVWSEWMCRPTSPMCTDFRPYNPKYAQHLPWSEASAEDWRPSLDVRFTNNYLTDIGGDGIIVRVTEGARVESNLVTDTWMRALGNSAGIWAINADNTVFQFNEVRQTRQRPEIEPGDGMAFDADMGTLNTIFRSNYSASNEGGLVLFCGCGKNENGQWASAVNTVVDNNFTVNDGRRAIVAAGSRGSVVMRNIFVAQVGHDAPIIENLANFDSNEVRLVDNILVAGTPGHPIIRRRNPEGSYDAISWDANAFIGDWADEPTVDWSANLREPAFSRDTFQTRVDDLFDTWARDSGFARNRYRSESNSGGD